VSYLTVDPAAIKTPASLASAIGPLANLEQARSRRQAPIEGLVARINTDCRTLLSRAVEARDELAHTFPTTVGLWGQSLIGRDYRD
jgi:hypothetical protein